MEKKSFHASRIDIVRTESRQFSSGSYYILLFVARGACVFRSENMEKACGPENIIVIKPGESVEIYFPGGSNKLQLLKICVLPQYLRELSDDETDLEAGFYGIPCRITVAHGESEAAMLIKNIAVKLIREMDEKLYGEKLYQKNLLSALLILSFREIKEGKINRMNGTQHVLMNNIFRYIKEHLTEDLPLERLEKEFFVSRYHICREFKRLTGQTPHAYIVKNRLDLCRKYIEQGKSIREVYHLGGFGSYNHFFSAFKKEYGMTPKQYYHNL